MKTNTIIQGDCLKILEKYKGSFDYCITSPPFKEKDVEGDYWEFFDKFIELLRKKVKKVAFVFNSSTKMREMFKRYPEIKRVLIWGKAPSCYSYRYEPIFVFCFDDDFKVNKYLFKDYWQEAPVLGNNHTYENPVKLYKEIMLKLPKGIVLDCFGGTGTTLVACIELGLKCVIIEKDKDKIKLIKRRLAQTKL